MDKYIVCAFYTDSYAAEVASLEASVSKFGLDFYKERYESRGYWEANTRIKPEFLLKCLEKFSGRDVVYLDADSVLRAHPHFSIHLMVMWGCMRQRRQVLRTSFSPGRSISEILLLYRIFCDCGRAAKA